MKPNKVLKSFDQLSPELVDAEPESSQPKEPPQAKLPAEKPAAPWPTRFPVGSRVQGYEGCGINE